MSLIECYFRRIADGNFQLERKCKIFWQIILVSCIVFICMLCFGSYALKSLQCVQIIYIDDVKPPVFTTSSKFLSVALDTSVVALDFDSFNVQDEKLKKVVRELAPGYFRIGGTLADRLYFRNVNKMIRNRKYSVCGIDGEACYEQAKKINYTLTGKTWRALANFLTNVNMDILFDLNSLIRFDNGSWNSYNSRKMMKFSAMENLKVNWELGNEPNAFRHQFDYSVNATQLAKDFMALRKILDSFPQYKTAQLVGPDTTRPQQNHKESEKYLYEFLQGAGRILDAITWHQYYFNGRTATSRDFTNPLEFDVLKEQITVVKNFVHMLGLENKPIWLGETSSAYGGGAPGLSDRFISMFIWLDKLGVAAKMGIDVVIRQSIFAGHYSLLDAEYNPNPDWWLSVIYKRLIGPSVVPCYLAVSINVRLYCHCTKNLNNSVTVFGMNLGPWSKKIRIESRQEIKQVHVYELTAGVNIYGKSVLLNGDELKLTENNDVPPLVPKIILGDSYIVMKPFSVVFYVVPDMNIVACA